MMIRTPLVVALFLCALVRSGAAQQYNSNPFIRMAGLDTAAIDSVRKSSLFFAPKRDALSDQEMADAREQIYFVIGSQVRQTILERVTRRNDVDLADVAQLFEHAAALGVYGAAEVARKLPLRPADVIGASPSLPDSMSITFVEPFLRIASARGGWAVEVPYYFMIGDVVRFPANNGMTVEAVSISTLFGRNENRPGVSQSTIFVAFSPTEKADDFNRYWLQQLGVSESDRAAESPRAGSPAYRAYDAASDMNKEVVLIRTARGPMAVAYIGLTGPFDVNRINFLDFLEHLKLP